MIIVFVSVNIRLVFSETIIITDILHFYYTQAIFFTKRQQKGPSRRTALLHIALIILSFSTLICLEVDVWIPDDWRTTRR